MVSKLGVLYAQEDYAAANGAGVATHLTTAPTVAKANAVEAEVVAAAAAAVETLAVSFQDPPLTSCLNIVMTVLAPPGTFIPMMLSLQLQRPSLHLALPATMPHAKGRLLLFLAKLPMKLPVDGTVLLMVNTRGDTAFSRRKTKRHTVLPVQLTLALPESNITAVVPSNLHGTTITGSVEKL